jgi:hypothetical protein
MKIVRSLAVFLVLFVSVEALAYRQCHFLFGRHDFLNEILIQPDVQAVSLSIQKGSVLDESDKKHLFTLEQKAKEVAQALSKKVSHFERIHTVVYPASGYDGVSALLAFPSARRVIGIDNHPFLTDQRSQVRTNVYVNKSEAHKGWAYYGAVDAKRYVADVLLGRIEHAFPGVRFLRIWHIRDKNYYSHGLIEFDTGPGTQVRQYVHVESLNMSSVWEEAMPWWLQSLKKQGFDAVLRKAAMHFFEYGEENSIPRTLLKELRNNKGVFVDGDSVLNKAEYRSSILPVGAFGYGQSIEVTDYAQ